MRVRGEGESEVGGESKGEGEGEFKGKMKAYGNITVPLIMQLSFIRYSYWFCKAQKRNFPTEIAFFCVQSL